MKHPEISIVMPVYNAGTYLPETIASLQAQTFPDFEVICVDDGSTDDSLKLLKQTMVADSRFRVLLQANAGAGAARNRGFQVAQSKYVIFLDSDDLFAPELLRTLYDAAEEQGADIAACNYCKFTPDGREQHFEGVYLRWVPGGKPVFSWQDSPDAIMSIINPVPWNKLYRSAFIREHDLRFEEISSTNDITFASVSAALAEKIVAVPGELIRYRVGHSGTITATKAGKLNNVRIAVQSAMRQALALPHGEQIRLSVLNFVIDNFLFSLTHYIPDFSHPEAAEFYQMVHETFNLPEFADLTEEDFLYRPQYSQFLTVKYRSYAEMRALRQKRLIVSLTTYPKRIHLIPQVLASIYRQTRQADEVVLWLAEEQFPGKEADLPEDLMTLVRENRLTLRWCDDLKPHKKYFYALQEYAEDLVVTIDDDLTYLRNTLETLYNSYLLYPEAVSTVRAHLITLDEENRILPYTKWIQESDSWQNKPSMQLLATNGAGVLHPPKCYPPETFDKQAILDHCLWADDLWLKAMQLIADVPVVLARQYEPLRYVPDSQEEGLHLRNVQQNQNDVQWQATSRWLDSRFGPDILTRKLTDAQAPGTFLGVQAMTEYLDRERKDSRIRHHHARVKRDLLEEQEPKLRRQLRTAQEQLQRSQDRHRETRLALQESQEKYHANREQLRQTQQKLDRVYAAMVRAQENAPIHRQLKNIGAALRQRRAQGGGLFRFAFKYFLYLLAWIPETILAALMYYLQNGGRAFLKQIARKLLKK